MYDHGDDVAVFHRQPRERFGIPELLRGELLLPALPGSDGVPERVLISNHLRMTVDDVLPPLIREVNFVPVSITYRPTPAIAHVLQRLEESSSRA
jgi:hypothetical protein